MVKVLLSPLYNSLNSKSTFVFYFINTMWTLKDNNNTGYDRSTTKDSQFKNSD